MTTQNLKLLASPTLLLALALCLAACDASFGEFDSPIENQDGEEPIDPDDPRYNELVENPFVLVADEPVSTFSIDADGGAYAECREYINKGQLPPNNAIRTEELINYFTYDYPNPTGPVPIELNGEVSECPWQEGHKLIRIGLQGTQYTREEMPTANYVALIDVSGSMSSFMPLVKAALNTFVDHMRSNDRLAIVVYASDNKVLLQSTNGNNKSAIRSAISSLKGAGSTNGSGGIQRAYDQAADNYIDGGNNRVILITDGNFNVGITNQNELIEFISTKRDTNIFLSVLGVGGGGHSAGTMEQLANNGNGNYEYLDTEEEAEKLFAEDFGRFLTVAKDVKIQVQFNPDMVEAYRLIGYENRLLAQDDFDNDSTDAGELGANQSVTALYELKPVPQPAVRNVPTFTIDFRYKLPTSSVSEPLALEVYDSNTPFAFASPNHQFAGAVAAYGMMLRNSQYKGSSTWPLVQDWTANSNATDPNGRKADHMDLLNRAAQL